jgi:hypothetical protein
MSTRALIVLLLAAIPAAAGCTTWSKTAIPPQAESLPAELRVQLKDGRTLTLLHASIVGDSLVGTVKAPHRRGHEQPERTAVALADIGSAEKNRVNVWVTLVVVAILSGMYLAFSGVDLAGRD